MAGLETTSPDIATDIIVNNISDGILTIDGQNRITFANLAAEQMLGSSLPILKRKHLDEIVLEDSPLMDLVAQARSKGAMITEYDVPIGNPVIGEHKLDIHVSSLANDQVDNVAGDLLIQLQKHSIAHKINQQQTHRNATRSVSGMAAMIAHEIKNPLSGIKGSAQILSQEVGDEDQALTDLICEEVDRICVLIDRMEIFTDERMVEKKPVNIHLILEHVKKLAENGFGKHVRFKEIYDPSLPDTMGDKGALIQVLLNLVKNACEAAAEENPQVTLTTSFKQGVKVAISGSGEMVHLPLEICVIDNGPGIPDDIRENIFDPFVTTKKGGTGLGLALAAKIINDHGGLLECDSGKGNTVFRILMPAANMTESETNE